MGTNSKRRPSLEVNRGLLLGGAAVFGIGGLLCAVGAAIGTVALVQAANRWVKQLEEPPTEVARRRLAQVKSAAVAGADAWRHEHHHTHHGDPAD